MTPALSERLAQSEQNRIWVHRLIGGLTAPLPADNRRQLAAAYWATVIEHHQAILLLTRAGSYASARALIRPLFEGYIRGLWLKIGASDHEVDVARQDRFPTFARMIEAIDVIGKVRGGGLSELNAAWWGQMCSLTPPQLQPIGSPAPKDSCEQNGDGMFEALAWADWTLIQAVRGFGLVAGEAAIVRGADEQLRVVFGTNTSPSALAV